MAQIRHLYNCAQEMSKVAKIASINQGVKVDELEMDDYARSVKNVIVSQLENLQFEFEVDSNGQLILIVPEVENTIHNKPSVIGMLVMFKNNIDSVNLIQNHIEKFDRLNQLNQ